MSDRVICHVRIRGRVQAVGFRAFVEHVALRHGVEGWVRNRRDGSVEAVFAGSTDAVRAVTDACRRGPPGARVDTLEEATAGEELLAQRPPGELFSMLRTE